MANVNGVAGEHLRSFIERIERLEEEKKSLADDIKEIFAEAKGTGFDVKAMRAIIKIRKMDKADVQEQSYMINIYTEALGMFQPDLFGVGDLEDPEKSKSILFDGLKRYVRQNPGTSITIKGKEGEFEKITEQTANA